MSRKIKVRAWFEPTKNHKKVYKEVYHKELPDLYCEYFTEQDWLNASDENWVDPDDFKKITFEQYTGSKDENGKEIYEGDIVKINGDIGGQIIQEGCGRWIIFKSKNKVREGGAVMFNEFEDSVKELSFTLGSEYCNVIGNIHENPELLRREKMND